jgi:hypothetical protein
LRLDVLLSWPNQIIGVERIDLSLTEIESLSGLYGRKKLNYPAANQRHVRLLTPKYGSMPYRRGRKIVKNIVALGWDKCRVSYDSI